MTTSIGEVTHTHTRTPTTPRHAAQEWPVGQLAPYQIKLDSGVLIFAPLDDERVIRAAAGAEVL